VYGTIRSQTTEAIEVEATDVDQAKEAVEAKLPPDAEVIECRSSSRGSGPVQVQATVRSTTSVPHEAVGDDYETAYARYRASIPEGWISLGIAADRS
jgi:hypothetical protein